MNHGLDGEKPISPCRQVLFAFTVLAVLLLSLYGNSFDCSWHFDDAANITNNTAIHLKSLSWNGIKQILLKGHVGANASPRPLAYLSFGLNYFFGGLDVFGYHLVNLLIHWVASIFLFLFIRAALNLDSLKKKYGSHAYPVALLAAVFWAVHPIQTQAVTYIVQRMTSLAGMFYIMSMYFYLKARTSDHRTRRVVFSLVSLFAFVLGMGSKENVLQLVPSIGLLELLLVYGTRSWNPAKKGKVFIGILGITCLVGLLWTYLGNGNVLSTLFAGYEYRPFTLWERLLTESRVVVFYLSLLLYPMPERLSIAHGFQVSTSVLNPVSTLPSLLFIFGIIGLLIGVARRYPLLSFSFLFFFVNHLMESTILPLELAYEHRNYVPSMLFFVPFAVGFCFLMEKYRAKRVMKYFISLFVVLAVVAFAHATYVRNLAWKSPKALWLDAAAKAPGESRVHHNLGAQYQGRGQAEKAMGEYEKALSLHKYQRKGEEAAIYFNLGNLHRDLGSADRAEYFYQQAIKVDPNCYSALNSLAVLYERQGRMDAVLPLLRKALVVEPESSHASFNLGLFFLKNGEPEKAVPFFNIAIRDPGLQHSVLVSSGVAYKQIGQRGKAAGLFEQAVMTNPKDITPRLHLIELYHAAGLERRALDQGEGLLDILFTDECLFYNTVDFILKKGTLKDVDLSMKIILPVLYQAMTKRGDIFNRQLSYLEKIFD
jgi:Tfp pilus assembly protein PilF